MRTIAFSMKSENFDRMPTPNTLRFKEPTALGDGYYKCTATGEDEQLIELINRVMLLESPEEQEKFERLSSQDWIELLKLFERNN